MTGPSYLTALHTLGLTPETAAPWLGVGRSTAYRYAQTGPIEPVARMIEMAVRVQGLERWDRVHDEMWDYIDGEYVRHSDLTAAVGLGG
jgi:hypothetical protein